MKATPKTINPKIRKIIFGKEITELEPEEFITIPSSKWSELSPKTPPSVYYYYYRDILNVRTQTIGDEYMIIKNK